MSDLTGEINIPEPLDNFLREKYGSVHAVETLTNVSESQVFRLKLQKKAVVVKKVTKKREIFFYEKLAPLLNAKGAATAKLEWSGLDRNIPWIAIEYLPFNLPENRWEADRGVIEYLSKAHSIPRTDIKIDHPFCPIWTEDMTTKALDCFDPSEQMELETVLKDIRLSSMHLFEPKCLICGDPNPKNWGLRIDDTLVQFDWHKIGFGTPAIDLAISICSSETSSTSMKAASIYLEHGHNKEFNCSKENLSNDILKGVVWNYVQFLSDYMEREVHVPEKLVEHIIEMFPLWLKQTPIHLD